MNQQAMLKKVRQMQKEMEETQQEICETLFTESAGGVVSVTMKGTKEIVKIEILDGFEAEGPEDFCHLVSHRLQAALPDERPYLFHAVPARECGL